MNLALAQKLLAAGRFAEAEAATGSSESRRRDPRLVIILARILAASGDNERALTVLDEARVTHPSSGPVHLNYGIFANDLARFDESRSAFARVLELQPENDLAHSYHALALLQTGHSADAASIFAARGFSDNRMFMVRLTEWMEAVWLANGRFFTQHTLNLTPAPSEPNKCAERRTRENRAQKYFYAKDYLKLLNELDPLARVPDCGEEVLFACAIAAEMAFDYERAFGYINAVAGDTETADPIRACRARTLVRLRRMEEAAKELNQILIVGPEDYGCNYFLGVICLAYGESERARNLFLRAYTDYVVDTLEYQFWQIQKVLLAAYSTDKSR